MKDAITIFIILLIIFLGANYIQKFLNSTSDLMASELEELKQAIKEKDKEKIQEKSDKIYSEWENINARWSVIVLHDEIDLIETSLIKMKSKIKIGKIDESIEDIDTSIFLVEHIKEKEKTNLKNIF